MPAALTEPPAKEHYQFVLRRYNRSPLIPITFGISSEMVKSRNIELGGVRAPTLFLKGINTRNRAVKVGWLDETERWFARGATLLDAQTIGAMKWGELRVLAGQKGVRSVGRKRSDVEADLLVAVR